MQAAVASGCWGCLIRESGKCRRRRTAHWHATARQRTATYVSCGRLLGATSSEISSVVMSCALSSTPRSRSAHRRTAAVRFATTIRACNEWMVGGLRVRTPPLTILMRAIFAPSSRCTTSRCTSSCCTSSHSTSSRHTSSHCTLSHCTSSSCTSSSWLPSRCTSSYDYSHFTAPSARSPSGDARRLSHT